MAIALSEKCIRELVEEAKHEMGDLGIDPTHERAWKELALCLINDRRQTAPSSSEDGEEFKIPKESYDRLMIVANAATRLIADHKKIEAKFLEIAKRTQKDVLMHAITALNAQEDWFDEMGVSRYGGLPTPLRLVNADLINVHQGRLGRLVSPEDGVIENAKTVSDSPSDRIRLTIHAYATSTVHRLIESGMSKLKAYKAVAEALEEAGFKKPGKNEAVKFDAVRKWYDAAQKGNSRFQEEYHQALQAAEADPEVLITELKKVIPTLMFTR